MSNDINLDINDFLSEDSHNLLFTVDLRKQIKAYLKLYNLNIIKDLSKIIMNILQTAKV